MRNYLALVLPHCFSCLQLLRAWNMLPKYCCNGLVLLKNTKHNLLDNS